MGATVSAADVRAHPFLTQLRDPGVSNAELQWGSGLAGLPWLHPAAPSDAAVRGAVAQTAAEVAAHSCGTRRLGEAIRHTCGAIDGVCSNRQQRPAAGVLCSLLLLLRHLLRAASDRAAGDAAELRRLCEVPGGEGKRAHAGVLAVDTVVALLIAQQPTQARDTGGLSAQCEALGVLTVACSAPLYAPASQDEQPSGFCNDAAPTAAAADPSLGGELIGYVASHADAGRLCHALLRLAAAADYRQHARGARAPYGETTALGTLVDYAASMVLPEQLLRQVAASGRRQCQQLSAHVGRRAMLLLCALLFHRKNLVHIAPTPVLAAFKKEGAESAGMAEAGHAELCDLFTADGALQHPEAVLLLYSLLNESPPFLERVLRYKHIELLVAPLLITLHHAAARIDTAPAQLYVLLTMLLVLSQHPNFNNGAHLRTLKTVTWYEEQQLSEITAGSLLIIELVRLMRANTTHARDLYVARQALSILSNMSGAVQNIHPHAAQRIVFLSIMLGKKAARLSAEGREDTATHVDFLSNVLGCINTCLTNNLRHNLALVYELMHKRSAFEELRAVPQVRPLLDAIRAVLDHFDSRLERDPDLASGHHTTVEAVMGVLKVAAPDWDESRAAALLNDRFIYAEEANPEGFFVPYVWDLVVQYYAQAESAPEWDPRALPLFASSSGSGAAATAPPSRGGSPPGQPRAAAELAAAAAAADDRPV